MTRVEQRTLKLIEQLGSVGDLISDRSRSEAAEVKRVARALTSLLKRKPIAIGSRKAASARAPRVRCRSRDRTHSQFI